VDWGTHKKSEGLRRAEKGTRPTGGGSPDIWRIITLNEHCCQVLDIHSLDASPRGCTPTKRSLRPTILGRCLLGLAGDTGDCRQMVPLSTLQKSPYQEAHNAAPFWVLLGASDKPDLHKLWRKIVAVFYPSSTLQTLQGWARAIDIRWYQSACTDARQVYQNIVGGDIFPGTTPRFYGGCPS
jgi:hypothetical protein